MVGSRKAFSMMELVFVIVIIGLLAAVAIPKFAVTRDDAVLTQAKNTVSSIRSAIAIERQKRVLRGSYDDFTSLGGLTGYDQVLFDYFDGDNTGPRILEYSVRSCKNANLTGCWTKSSDTTYVYKMPSLGTAVTFTFDLKSRFDCDADSHTRECRLLTE
ncbi:type II secretion system protein [Sulfurovum sp. zt1-1]|uniref:Type II secretion system protein n=1 Tax=Sulfurovum zhangzhouensis TaxID=3019067 RepID=A0ABT7QXA3_9BACT|nr:type II secretion system protein [Sulfurovum zhangzhouensis]MDM5271423.1 type II secretion system protein [Sulfurovum zhangzhouensis]